MKISPAHSLQGRVVVNGDRSIAHRALFLGALAQGVTRIANVSSSDDMNAARRCLEALGVPIERNGGGTLLVRGRQLRESSAPLDCGGSGATIRQLAGLLAGLPFTSTLAANKQLARRPMGRVSEPLRLMGADVHPIERPPTAPLNGARYPVMVIRGGGLRAIDYTTPVASAQIKSCVLLAALHADGTTTVRESGPSRDHTELMMRAMGAQVTQRHAETSFVTSLTPSPLSAINLTVPNDFSSAAFFMAAAWLTPNAEIVVEAVGLNPTRTGLLDIIQRMGGCVELENVRAAHGELVGDVRVKTQKDGWRGVTIGGDLIPRAIDEYPLVALLATQAEGETLVRDAAELRVKESDRVATTVEELRKMGAQIDERPDGFVVRGPTQLRGARVDSHGDHRLAMTLAVAGLIANGQTVIDGSACVSKSFPDFEKVLMGLVK
jgi:3-phosphoshikimate 1-carboxyvinyltransferase